MRWIVRPATSPFQHAPMGRPAHVVPGRRAQCHGRAAGPRRGRPGSGPAAVGVPRDDRRSAVLEAVDDGRPPSSRKNTRTGVALAMCSARWPGGNSAPFSRIADLEVDLAAVVRAEPERGDLREALGVDVESGGRSTGDVDGPEAGRCAAEASASCRRAAARQRERPGRGARAGRASRDPRRTLRSTTRREPRAAAPGLDRGLAGGAPRARRGAGLVRRQLQAPQRAQRVDPARSWARSASRGRPTGRPARRTRRSRRPAASTAGIIASSEPPVVRMSSTSSTRSPGRISKPRRNSRRGPSSRGDLLREDRARPELAPGLEREDHAAGRGAGDEVDRRRSRPRAGVRPPRTRTARSSPRGPGAPGTSRGTRRSGGRS